MTPKDRTYLIHISNMLMAAGRHVDGRLLEKSEVKWHTSRPEDELYIQISHLAALDMAIRLREMAIMAQAKEVANDG